MKNTFLILLSILCVSCSTSNDGNGTHIINTNSLIIAYADITEYKADIHYDDPDAICLITWKHDSVYRKDYNAEGYNHLCERYNDKGYKKKVEYGVGEFPPNCFCLGNIVSMDITSDTDYDHDHPAGESLNNLFEILSMSPLKFISSSYTDFFDWDEYEYLEPFRKYFHHVIGSAPMAVFDQRHMHPIKKRLSELTPSDLILAGNGRSMAYYNSSPSLVLRPVEGRLKPAKYTITMKNDRGRTYEVMIEVK